MEVKVINESGFELPKYETEHSAGLDLRAKVNVEGIESIVLRPGDSKVIPTGIKVEIPSGYEIQIRPRSGMAAVFGITVLNSPGTIDADFRGEIGVILINHGKQDFQIKNGDRIAQMVLNKFERIEFNESENLSGTERGEGGFGSTGIS